MELKIFAKRPVCQMLSDSEAALGLAKNAKVSSRNKHIEIKHLFVREIVMEGLLKLMWVCSADNIADLLTKPLAMTVFWRLVLMMGLN